MLLFTPSLRQCGPGLTLHNETLLTHGSQTVAQVPTGVLVGFPGNPQEKEWRLVFTYSILHWRMV